jgi:hypothetical protein
MVSILDAKNESAATNELMAEIARQNKEIEQLRKIIGMIRSVLRNETPYSESAPPARLI